MSEKEALADNGLTLGLKKPSFIGQLGFKVLEPGNGVYRDIMPEAFMVFTIVHAKKPLSAWNRLLGYGEILKANCFEKNRSRLDFTGICGMMPVYDDELGPDDEVEDIKYTEKAWASDWVLALPNDEELREGACVPSFMPGFKSNGIYLKCFTSAALTISGRRRRLTAPKCECYVAWLSFAERLKKSEATGRKKCNENDMIRLYFANSVDEAINAAQEDGQLVEKVCEDFPDCPALYFYGLWGGCKVNRHSATLCELFHCDSTIDDIEPFSYQTMLEQNWGDLNFLKER